MKIQISLRTGEQLTFICDSIKLDNCIFRPKRKAEKCLKIDEEDRITTIKLSDINYLEVEE